jgi:large subunit ribosomal protein L3
MKIVILMRNSVYDWHSRSNRGKEVRWEKMILYMIAHKKGMTQIFDEDGKVLPVTVLQFVPGHVVMKKTEEKDGYNALVLGFEDIKESKMRKSEAGLYKKSNIPTKRMLKESRVGKKDLDNFEIGQEIGIDIFQKDEHVDVSAKSKGRGFTGVMKRHGMAGAKSSHGTHEYFRHGGSIGASAYPSRVFKGKKMPGRYGGTKVKIQNLLIAAIRPEKNIMLVKGAVPGPNKGYITVSHAVKKQTVQTRNS